MALPVIVLAALAVVLFIILFGYKRRPKNYPPGPLGYPFLGSVTSLGFDGYKVAMKMTEKYGEIIGLRMGSNWLVILNNPDDIRECFSKPEFSARTGYNGLLDEKVQDSNYGVIMSTGKTWVEHRRFSLRTLRDFGFGKRSMESIIMEEVRELTRKLKDLSGQPFKTALLFNPAIFNVIWAIVAGQRYDYDDPKLTELQELLLEFFKSGRHPIRLLLFMFPELATVKAKFPWLIPTREGDKFREKVFDFFRKTIAEHERTLSEGNPRDFIDTYLEEVRKTEDPSSSFYRNSKDGDINLIATLLDLFIAGSETTSTTLMWTFFLLGQHPKVQEKFAKEIKSLVGNREVLLADRPHLPYVEATILEVMRISSLAAFGVPHSPSEDIMFKGFFIPKDTIIFGNLYAAHFNPSIWGDPENFRPERFLSADEKTVIRNKAWMPFGVGKRQCMGESLARDELFLFFTNLVHNFEIKMPEDEPVHSLEGVNIGVLTPPSHNVIVNVRR